MSALTPAASLNAQIVIAVHDLERPVRRAVDSVLRNPGVGAVIVAHGVDPADLDLPTSARIQVVSTREGLGYPGRAFNAGLKAATAPLVGIMGSDDWYEDGAVSQMMRRIGVDKADGVLAPLRHQGAASVGLNPVTWRRRQLRPVADRMFFRTAPIGLFRRELLTDPRHLMTDDVVAGIDQIPSALLYTGGYRIGYYPTDGAYVVGNDAKTRVTFAPRPLQVQGEAWSRMWEDPRILALAPGARRALAEKFVEVHVLGAVNARPTVDHWAEGDFEWLSALAARVKCLEPKLDAAYSRARVATLKSIISGDLESTLRVSRRASYLDWRLPSNPTGVLHRNFWLRVELSALLSRCRDAIAIRGNGRSPGEE